jgi:hypothetical protein
MMTLSVHTMDTNTDGAWWILIVQGSPASQWITLTILMNHGLNHYLTVCPRDTLLNRGID